LSRNILEGAKKCLHLGGKIVLNMMKERPPTLCNHYLCGSTSILGFSL